MDSVTAEAIKSILQGLSIFVAIGVIGFLALYFSSKADIDNPDYNKHSPTPKVPIDPNTPKCPKCGSTAITTGARGVNLTSGMIGASKTVNRCANCGHTWKPNGR